MGHPQLVTQLDGQNILLQYFHFRWNDVVMSLLKMIMTSDSSIPLCVVLCVIVEWTQFIKMQQGPTNNLRQSSSCASWLQSTFYIEILVSSWDGLRWSPLSTLATNWPVVSALDDRWWAWNSRLNENWQGKLKYLEKTCTSAILSTTNPTWPDLGSIPGCRSGKLVTNCLSNGTTYWGTKFYVAIHFEESQ
jgi:hypothetical protein